MNLNGLFKRTPLMNDHPLAAITLASGTWFLSMALGAGALAATPMPVKPFRIIDTICDVTSKEISPTGQLVCQYVCRDRDHTKVTVVFSTSGSGQCRTPIDKKVKQTIKTEP
jgi:hypothetical protein